MAVLYKVIGSHIRRAREEAGLTQDAMAEALDISSAHYGRIERGSRTPTLDMLDRIANVLNRSYIDFLAGSSTNESRVLEKTKPRDYDGRFDALIQGCPDTTADMLLNVCQTIAEHIKK